VKGVWVVRRISVFVLLLMAPLILMSCSGSGNKASGLPPKAPESVSVEMTPQGVSISWDSVPGASHYTVFWGEDPRNFRSMTNSPTNSLLLSGLPKEKTYYVAVTTWNPLGESNFSPNQVLVYDDEPGNSGKYLAKGEEMLQKGYYFDARAYFSASINCNPENPDAYQRRAMVHEKMSRADLAKSDYAKAESIYKKKMSSSQPTKGAFLKN